MTLTEFLLARIADDEAACGGGDEPESWCDRATGVHYDPARVLAECEAKRRIVEQASRGDVGTYGDMGYLDGLLEAVALLALPYADHPDYRAEWKP